MTSATILVTGATGKTGAYAVPMLLNMGHGVRAFVHAQDDRAERLRAAGAEVVVGDLLDFGAVERAAEGATAGYFCYPIAPGLVEATAIFAHAAKSAGFSAIVNMSQISARPDAGSDAARQHWLSERVFNWSGVPATHLRPTFFAEWLALFADQVRTDGTLRLAFGEGRHAPIAAEDQARVIAAILHAPETHGGQTYKLFGPKEFSHHEIAAEMARSLDRPVRYQPTSIDAFAELLRARGRSEHAIQHLSNVAADYQAGLFSGTNDVVERVGGRPATTVHDFVAQRRQMFAAAA